MPASNPARLDRRAGATIPALLGLSLGCAAALHPGAFDSSPPSLDPLAFFAGRTHPWAMLQNGSGAPVRRIEVSGAGVRLSDGALRLDQTTVSEGKSDPRRWLIRKVDAHRYEASLTDAAGPVRGEAYGNLLHLKYAAKGKPGVTVEQWLYLQPDGRTVLNEDVMSAFGIVLFRLSELITHEGGSSALPGAQLGPSLP